MLGGLAAEQAALAHRLRPPSRLERGPQDLGGELLPPGGVQRQPVQRRPLRRRSPAAGPGLAGAE